MNALATATLFEIEQAFLDAVDAYEQAIERREELEQVEPTDENADLAEQKQMVNAEVEARQEALASIIATELQKVDNIAGYDDYCERMEAGCRAVRDRAAERMRVWKHRRDRLRSSVLAALQSAEKVKVESAMHFIRRQNSPPSVELTGETELPEQFVRTKVIREVDKTKIQQAILRGEEVPGARLVRGEHVRIG